MLDLPQSCDTVLPFTHLLNFFSSFHNIAYCPYNDYFECDNGLECVPEDDRCNGEDDCLDGSDEDNCSMLV